MKTSSFIDYGGPGMIAITVGAPPVSCKVHRALAPRRNMLKLAYHEYRPQFFHILSRLDAQAEWVTLHKIAEGHEPVLLCFEHPPFSLNNWCHRRMVAEWFEKELGHQVEELGHGMIPIRGVHTSQGNLFDEGET